MQSTFYNLIQETEDILDKVETNEGAIKGIWSGYWEKSIRKKIFIILGELKSYLINHDVERFIPFSSEVINKINVFTAIVNRLDKEDEEIMEIGSQLTGSPFMAFKKRLYMSRASQFKRDTISLIESLNEIRAVVHRFEEEYKNEFKNSAEKTQDGVTIVS